MQVKTTQLLIELANLCYPKDGCQGGSQTKAVITAWSCSCQFETQRSTEQRSPSLVPASPSPPQPQFSSLSQVSVTTDVTGSLHIAFIRKSDFNF